MHPSALPSASPPHQGDEVPPGPALGGALPPRDPAGGARVDEAVTATLAGQLLAGRPAADLAHVLLAGVTVGVFWSATPPWVSLTWLGLFVATAAARWVNRRRASAPGLDVDATFALVRRDVWIAASLWGGWALLQAGSSTEALLFLMLIFSGLVAAATSTLVADRRAFLGFMGLLFGPLAGTIVLSGWSRDHASMLLLMFVFAPFMVVVHRRARVALVGHVRGREQLRVSEEEAAARRDFLDALVTSAPSSIVVLDREGRVMWVNPAFERCMGFSAARAHGVHFLALVAGDEGRTALAGFVETVQQGGTAVAELPLTSAGGETFWMRLAGTPARGAAEGTTLILAQDVTQQVEAREAQVQARIQAEEAARAKSAFLASMSHEIRTPMNGILGMVEILLDSPLPDEQRRTAEVIRSSAHGLLRILNDVLDVSKIEAGQLDLETAPFNLHDVVGEVGRVFAGAAAKAENELLVDVGEGVPVGVTGDAHRLRQVLSNLVGNAVKFTRRGEVVLSARALGMAGNGHRIRFAVRDTGVGIPPEKQQVIFNPFEQADSSTTRIHGGTGLGLSISKRLVELMGGRIGLESVPGEGSDFHFELVLPAASGVPREDVRGTQRVPLAGRRFLVVDDNATARRIVRSALAHAGAGSDEAESVDEGLAMALTAARAGTPYELVVLDQMMPVRDGLAFAEAVRDDAAFGSPRLLMVTSAALPGGAVEARAAGIGGYLAKPVSRTELLAAVQALLASPDHAGAERSLVTRETIRRVAGRARVLLAEDNPVNQQVAVTLLTKRGHEVFSVADGRQAVEAAQRDRFDVVLMDIQMPEMDGLEATRRIRRFADAATLPIVALTAHAFAEERERTKAAGMNDFLTKPFKPEDLYAVVERWCAVSEAEAAEGGSGGPPRVPEGDHVHPVDLDGFRAVMRAAGVEDVVEPTVAIYMEEAPGIFDVLEKAVDAGDPQGAGKAAHSLKSASGNIRAHRLFRMLQETEDAGRRDDLPGVRAGLPALRAEFDAVMAYLRSAVG